MNNRDKIRLNKVIFSSLCCHRLNGSDIFPTGGRWTEMEEHQTDKWFDNETDRQADTRGREH